MIIILTLLGKGCKDQYCIKAQGMCKQRGPVRGLGTGKDQRLYSKRNMVHRTLQYEKVTYNPTLCQFQSQLQNMYHGHRATLCQSRP
jgi:hypothetical protein